MAKRSKKVDQIRQLYHLADNTTRRQWQKINQKGYEFAHDEQLAADDKASLEEQGMPTFTINRILPVVDMLNLALGSSWRISLEDAHPNEKGQKFIAEKIYNEIF